MYQYDSTIFNGIVIPADMDKETLINRIMLQCGDNEVLYPNTALLTTAINTFFKSNEYKYTKLWQTMHYDYDPLLNYDLEINEKRTVKNSNSQTSISNGNTTVNNNSNTEQTTDITNTHSVSAYDTTDWSNESQDIQDGHTVGDENSIGTENREDTENIEGSGTQEETYNRTEKGDNSARSTMSNIQQQRDLVDFDIYGLIASEFEDAITITTYTYDFHNEFTGGC